MMALQQGIINLFAIGLYHLFEQQLVLFFRRQILHPSEEDNFRLLTMKNIIARFKVLDIDITTLPSWEKIIKLKLIANCVKHADGSSCEELKELHPNLFRHSRSSSLSGEELNHQPGRVYMPMGGEDIYVAIDTLQELAVAVKSFWPELWNLGNHR